MKGYPILNGVFRIQIEGGIEQFHRPTRRHALPMITGEFYRGLEWIDGRQTLYKLNFHQLSSDS